MTDLQFTKYYEKNYQALLNFARKFTNNLSDAEDLVQETALKAFKAKDSFTMGTSFKSWSFTILKNAFITKYNKAKRRNVSSHAVEDLIFAADKKYLSENDAVSKLKLESINESIDLLSYKTKMPFLMHIEGYQYDEIAEQLNIPLGTVKSRINFARTKLKNVNSIAELIRA